MARAVKRTLSLRPEVDRMLAVHVQRTRGTTLSSMVNAALVDYLETAALEEYRRWDADADADERAALDAFSGQDWPCQGRVRMTSCRVARVIAT